MLEGHCHRDFAPLAVITAKLMTNNKLLASPIHEAHLQHQGKLNKLELRIESGEQLVLIDLAKA